MGEIIFFFIFAGIAIGSAVAVVSFRNPVHSVISLMVCFLQMAAIFVLLRSPFIAVIQVFVYVGAVLVLFLFVIMMLDIRKASIKHVVNRGTFWIVGILGVLIIEMVLIISGSGLAGLRPISDEPFKGGVREIGETLFTKYILPFEVVSIILLVALIGAIVMGRKELKS